MWRKRREPAPIAGGGLVKSHGILTQEGLKRIEDITINDLVWTHQHRWQPVEHIETGEASVWDAPPIRGGGVRLLARKGPDAPMEWVAVDRLKPYYVAAARQFEPTPLDSLEPLWPDPTLNAQYMGNPAFWELVGCWASGGELARLETAEDGTTTIHHVKIPGRERIEELVIKSHVPGTSGWEPQQAVVPAVPYDYGGRIDSSGSIHVMARTPRPTPRQNWYIIESSRLAHWLHRYWGLRSRSKIPLWVVGLPEPLRQAFLGGFNPAWNPDEPPMHTVWELGAEADIPQTWGRMPLRLTVTLLHHAVYPPHKADGFVADGYIWEKHNYPPIPSAAAQYRGPKQWWYPGMRLPKRYPVWQLRVAEDHSYCVNGWFVESL